MPKILVIEDETAVRENIQDILELERCDLITAENGLIGVHLAQTELPDLIICDVMMPELDGYGVLEQLRRSPATATIPFIFLTAKAERTDLRQGMELGADDYLVKPFTASELCRAIAIRIEKHTAIMEQYHQECDRGKQLQKQAKESQTFAEAQVDIFQKIAVELRNPLSNINMAIWMLEKAKTDEERDRYLKVLKQECAREIVLLNEVAQLQKLLTPSNTSLLRRLQLLD